MADYFPRILVDIGSKVLELKSPERDGSDGWTRVPGAFNSMVLKDDNGLNYLGMSPGKSGEFKQVVEFGSAQKSMIAAATAPKVIVRFSWKSAGAFLRLSVKGGSYKVDKNLGRSDDWQVFELEVPKLVIAGAESLEFSVRITNTYGAGSTDGTGITRIDAEINTGD